MNCGLCAAPTAGRHLCEWDARSLAKRLADLPTLYAEVGQCLVPRRSGWGEIVATHGAAGPRSPIDEDVLDTVNTGRAAEVVHLWRVDVQRERWPHHAPPPPAQLYADCRWLAMELDWIVAHYPVVGELAREVRTLERQARTIVGDPAPRPKEIGRCVAVTDDEGTVCGAAIMHVAGQSRLSCRQCGTSYRTETDLLLLLHYQPKGVA
ncbi:hypothetical protein [Streptomyces sp. NPDC096311]|uniref:hypothetical protein n=1 Tax=Streptomyces sp. NPDC096311 TaxID=3366083 RepID=UPI0037F49F50